LRRLRVMQPAVLLLLLLLLLMMMMMTMMTMMTMASACFLSIGAVTCDCPSDVKGDLLTANKYYQQAVQITHLLVKQVGDTISCTRKRLPAL
jgi:hypothetical protein